MPEPMDSSAVSVSIEREIRGTSLATPGLDRAPNRRTIRAFENIVRACNQIADLKAPITVAAVAKFTAGCDGGPSYGGLRNNNRFVAYVAARTSEQRLGHQKEEKLPAFPKTGDPQIDANISALRAHNQLLQKQIRDLKRLFRSSGKFDVAAILERGELVLTDEGNNANVSDTVRSAISALLDPRILESVGLKLEESGQISNPRTMRILLGKRQVDSLRNLAIQENAARPVESSQTLPE